MRLLQGMLQDVVLVHDVAEQERRPMQGDHGLAGARSARNDRYSLIGSPNRFVLFGLNGSHDVVHPRAAAALQGRQYRGQLLHPILLWQG